MHMSDSLLSPAVSITMCALSAGAVAYSAAKIKKDELDERRIPLMGVMGAFVFAAQMINFTIPVTGSSGHIGGGILLAALLGEFPAFLCISAVLIIQALFFADGGLLALGCNIFNMGVIACFFVYPLIFKPLIKKVVNKKSLTLASIAAVVVGLQAGAFGVVLETTLSGVTELPFGAFLLLMQPIHLAIGFVEGVVTAAVLVFVHKMRPEIIESASSRETLKPVSVKRVVAALAIATVMTGGALSLLASSYPDGLEWSTEGVAGTAELAAEGAVFEASASVQEATAFMPDYDYKTAEDGAGGGTTIAGLVGGALAFALAFAAGLVISAAKKKKTD